MHRLNRILFSVLVLAVTAFGGGTLVTHFQDLHAREAWTESYAPFFWVAFIALMLWCIVFASRHPTAVRLGLSSILATAVILLLLLR
jgi:hypothetical protein